MPSHNAAVIPTLRYRDAPRAIQWLCDTLGFREGLVVPGPGSSIRHAQLLHGRGMVMIGSPSDEELARWPADLGASVTQGVYVVVSDVADHYARALAAGARIERELEPQEYGGSLYSCRDPEGYVWHVGSYDPWAVG